MKQETAEKISVLGKLFATLDHLYLWELDDKLALRSSTCPSPDLFLSMFQISKCGEQAVAHFSASDKPTVLTDALGFIWLVCCDKQDGAPDQMYVLGPAFTSDLSEKNILKRLEALNLPHILRRELLAQIHAVPVMRFELLLRYCIMLHFTITGQRISYADIVLDSGIEKTPQTIPGTTKPNTFHGTWHYERQMQKYVREGDLSYAQKLAAMPMAGQPGMMCPGDPLRQVKNEVLVHTVLCTRAAIEGGMTPDFGYSLSDYYIQQIEAAPNISAVRAISPEMMDDFVHRVHEIKERSGYSQLTISCMDYIDQHITEKIQISEIASTLAYVDYYLTTKFKKDTGINLRDYICMRKVDQAKLLLKTTSLSVQDISKQLAFSSSSYFCSVFRKFAGVTPNEFRESGQA